MGLNLRAIALLLASTAVATAEHYRFRIFGPEDGLNTAVTQVLQDRSGFLWAGTGDGLFRYDGARFQPFGTEDGLPSASIRCLHESADGTLWIVTGRGLVRRRQNRFERVITGTESIAGDWHAIGSSKQGELYLGHDRGLAVGRIASAGPMRFRRPPGTPAEPVWGIYVEETGSVWFGCGRQLCLLERRGVKIFGAAEGLPAEHWGTTLRDLRGNLWVRGQQHLYVMRPGAHRFEACDRGLPQSSNLLMSVIQDREGDLLVSTDLGLARLTHEAFAADPTLANGRWQLIGTRQGLEADTVTSLYQDREDSLWIGLWGAGLARWAGHEEWKNWTTADGMASNVIWAVRRQAGGPLWIGTDRGIVRMDGDVPAKTWTKSEGLAGDKVKAIVTSRDGSVWAGCLPGGVSRIDRGGRIRTYRAESGLTDTNVIGLFIDAESRLWVSTSGGLFRSTDLGRDLRFERLSPPGSRERTMYLRFLGDKLGRVWIGSSDGLFCWDKGTWKRLGQRDGLKSDGVAHIAETGDGALWVAYREPIGMSRLVLREAGVEVQHFTRKEGLPSDYVLFLGLDSRRRLWAGTDAGIAVQSPGNWIVYTHEDGLVWDDCAANAFWSEADGTVWIGTLKGLSRFQPKEQPHIAPSPPPVITSVLGDRSADPAGFSDVPFRDHDFFVSFSALTYVTEKNVRFRYRLAGLQDNWIETTLREARFPSLPAGMYRFEMSARRMGGEWNPEPATLSFRIVPPWWQTWWFRGLALGVLAALIAGAARVRWRKVDEEHHRLEKAVRERTVELELQNDVVERQKKEIEELLRRTEEVSRLKSAFLANMSHEIRTPMNGVIGMTQLVLDTPLDAEQRDYIATIRDSAESLLVIINDILDFSKIEAGKMELAQEVFDLRKCVNDALQVVAWKAAEKELPLRCDIADDVPRFVVGDPNRLRQILLNLLGNALKFTQQGKIALSVRAQNPAPADDTSSTTLRFSVRDTGIGIPFDKQVMIFEAFAQVDGSISRRQGGTGLGLAICSKLVHLMRGRLQVESAPGFGSDFFFTLTLGVSRKGPESNVGSGEALQAVSAGSHSFPKAQVPLHILLAEDNVVNQKLARQILGKLGHSVAVVGNGREAIEAALGKPFDLILMDVQMPDMDGFEATREIRAVEDKAAEEGRPGCHVPIVALTAHAMSGDRELCLQAGMDGYLSKPLHLQTLVETIDRVSRTGKAATEIGIDMNVK